MQVWGSSHYDVGMQNGSSGILRRVRGSARLHRAAMSRALAVLWVLARVTAAACVVAKRALSVNQFHPSPRCTPTYTQTQAYDALNVSRLHGRGPKRRELWSQEASTVIVTRKTLHWLGRWGLLRRTSPFFLARPDARSALS